MSDSLAHYLAAWQLADPQLLADTPTSQLYVVTTQGEAAVLKLLTPVGIHDEHCGAEALRRFDGRGAVRMLRHDGGAHLLENAEGSDLLPLVEQGEDERATILLAGVLRQLHASPDARAGTGLISLHRRFCSLFRQARQDQCQGIDSIYVRGARVAAAMLASPRERCVLHGDFHHANVRHSARRGWLAFDPKGLYGERTFDVANILCNPVSMPALVQDEARLLRCASILARQLDLDRPRILAYGFAYACLSACWSLEDGGDASLALRVAALAEPHAQLP